VTAATAAFVPSLAGLVADLRYGAPTGDLVAVPVVAAVMLDAAVRSRRGVWGGRLGHGDLVVAAGLGVLAALLVLLPAGRVTNGQWLTRLDLLAYPVALAACAVLLLGLRVLAVGVVPLSYGLLVWPWPVTWLNIHAVAPLTEVTYQASGRLAQVLGVAEMVDVGADNTLRVGAGEAAFEVAVAPACSGIAGIVAYSVVAGAVVALTRGRLRPRLAWLGCGLLAVWLGNVVRIVALAAAGKGWGADVAIGLLHPVAGLVLDAVVVAIMVALMGRFGLAWAPVARGGGAGGPATANAPAVALGSPPVRALAVRGLLALVLTAVLLGATTRVAGAADRSLVATAKRPLGLTDIDRLGSGAQLLGREQWSTVYFGAGSTWDRYRVHLSEPAGAGTAGGTGGGASGGSGGGAGSSMWLDSLVVDDGKALRAHDVLACYSFHGAQVALAEPVRLAGRITATRFTVTQADGERWQSLYWEWPLTTENGLRHERVTLFVGGLPPSATPAGAPTGSGIADLAAGPAEAADPAAADLLLRAAETLVTGALSASRGAS
jgi:exosortase